MHEGSHCVDTVRTGPLQCSCMASHIPCECGFVGRSRQVLTAPVAPWLLDRWPGTAYTQNGSSVFQPAPLAQKPWRLTIKHKGHRHMHPIQRATLGLKDKMICLENFGRNGSLEVVICFTVSHRNLNQTSALTVWLRKWFHRKAMLASNFTVRMLKGLLHLGPSYTCRLLFSPLGRKRKSSLVSVLYHFSLFLSQVLFPHLRFLVSCTFSISFLANLATFFKRSLSCHEAFQKHSLKLNEIPIPLLKRTISWLNTAPWFICSSDGVRAHVLHV